MNSFPNKIWRDRALLVLMQVLKFISIITRSPFASKFSLLDRNMFKIIGDKAADFNFYLLNDYFRYMVILFLWNKKPKPSSRMKYFITKHLHKICYMKTILEYMGHMKFTLEPESVWLLLWNIILLVHINLNILYVTSKFAFDFNNHPP